MNRLQGFILLSSERGGIRVEYAKKQSADAVSLTLSLPPRASSSSPSSNHLYLLVSDFRSEPKYSLARDVTSIQQSTFTQLDLKTYTLKLLYIPIKFLLDLAMLESNKLFSTLMKRSALVSPSTQL